MVLGGCLFPNAKAADHERRWSAPPKWTILGLDEFQLFQLHLAAAYLGKVVLGLLHKPAFLSAAENLGQPDGHFGGYAALLVDEFRKRVARYAKGGGGVRDA